MESLIIQLMGREYQVSVKPEEKETLMQAVTLVNEKLMQLSGKTTSGSESLAIMTALHIAHDTIVTQRQNNLDIPACKRRIESMNERVAKVLASER